MAKDDRDAVRARLEEEQARLQHLLGAIAEGEGSDDPVMPVPALDELSSVDQHPADVGTEVFERAKDLSIIEDVSARLADVEWAMKRLEDGTYGSCEACGAPIGDARLEARPAARYCVKDQARIEREVGAA